MTYAIDFAELYPDSMNWADEFLHEVDNALANAAHAALTACLFRYLATLEAAEEGAPLPKPDRLAPVWTLLDASGWYFSSEELPGGQHLLFVPGTQEVLNMVHARVSDVMEDGGSRKAALAVASADGCLDIRRRCSAWRMADVLPPEQLTLWRTRCRNQLMTATLEEEYPERPYNCTAPRWEHLRRRVNALNMFCQLTPDLAADPYRVELYNEDCLTTDEHAEALFGVLHTTPETDARLDRDTYGDLLRLLEGSGIDTLICEFHDTDATRTAFSFPVNCIA